ncbi:MAG: hypothetical protein Q8930_15355 [Bacillota bacterium]|nr:hypothetical protein [Bacillota bacterium]
MDINKAIRKQNKSYKRFMLIMCFIFFMFPAILYLSEKYNLFLMIYLFVLEFVILISVFSRLDRESLKYECMPGKLKITQGYFKTVYTINCEKVVYVHTEQREDESGLDIVMLTNSKFRNSNIKAVDNSFLKLHAYVSHEYIRIKQLHPENEFYYIIISKGGLHKEKLLLDIYKSCVKAKYSTDAIDCIKKWNI